MPPEADILLRVSSEYARVRDYRNLVLPEDADVIVLVDAMRDFLADFRHSTLDTYWHRKSGQVVLCILTWRQNGQLTFTRGINSELSLVSGSACAERAAIAAAFSTDLSITRQDFVAVGVLQPIDEAANPLRPCGVCTEWIKKIQDVNPEFRVINFDSYKLDKIYENFPGPPEQVVITHTKGHDVTEDALAETRRRLRTEQPKVNQ